MAEGVEFKTKKAKELKFGENNFIEVARKTAVTDQGENDFVSISKGYYRREDGEKRFKMSIAFPPEEKFVKEVIDALKEIVKD